MVGGPVSEELLARLHPLEVKVLPYLKDKEPLSTLAANAKMQDVEAMRACQWLENKGALKLEPLITHEVTLDENGTAALQGGMPELRFLKAIQEGANTAAAAAKKAKLSAEEIGVSLGLLKRQGFITLNEDSTIALTEVGKGIDTKHSAELTLLQKLKTGVLLQSLTTDETKLIEQLRLRKRYLIIKERRDRTVQLTPLGKQLAKVDVKKLDFTERVTTEDLKSGAWEQKKYRAFDVTVNVPKLPAGKEHFVQEALEFIRSVWIEMGFSEMEGNIVQSAFWDLDALFVPQDHPARETQDTFYLANPARTSIPKDVFERVRDVHERGGNTGSLGWQTPYSKDEAQKLMLRTHTTVVSAQTLWAIKQGKLSMPGKYFIVGRVFRNEKLDWKHLFEFHQVEGIVVGKDITFAHLISYLRTFFAKMGFPDVRVRPHHFPYTEPSVEVDVWNPRKQQWVELGGAGFFRPEVTKTLLGEDIPVIAWGLGLERIIVEYFSLQDLRDLYRNDIGQLREMKRFLKLEGN